MKLFDLITRFGELATYLQIIWTIWVVGFVVLVAVSLNSLTKSPQAPRPVGVAEPTSGNVPVPDATVRLQDGDIELMTGMVSQYQREICTTPAAAAAYRERLKSLVDKFETNPAYQTQTPEQVATVYRLYAATFLFGPEPANTRFFNDAVLYATKALRFRNSFTDVASLERAIQFFSEVGAGRISQVDLDVALGHNFRLAMINASEADVRRQVDLALEIVRRVKGGAT